MTQPDDWIQKARDRLESAKTRQQGKLALAQPAADRLQKRRDRNFLIIEKLIRQTAAKLSPALDTHLHITEVNRVSGSLMIRKEGSPGVRIVVELEPSGSVLLVHGRRFPSPFQSMPLERLVFEISFDDNGKEVLSLTGRRVSIAEACRRIFEPFCEASSGSHKD